MSRPLIAILIALTLAALLGWQWTRERQVNVCRGAGGIWNGPKSRCEPLPGSPILRRNIERT